MKELSFDESQFPFNQIKCVSLNLFVCLCWARVVSLILAEFAEAAARWPLSSVCLRPYRLSTGQGNALDFEP